MKHKIRNGLALMLMLVWAAAGAGSTALAANKMTTVQPENVKIHLFDYWVTGETDEDSTISSGAANSVLYNHTNKKTGINKDHALLFISNGGGLQYGWWNARTTGRLVLPYLVNGYPRLDLNTAGHTVLDSRLGTGIKTFDKNLKVNVFKSSDTETPLAGYSWEATPDGTAAYGSDATGDESLEYLFKQQSNAANGKKYYQAANLLQYNDQKKQYFFNSSQYYAEYSKTTKQFTVYDKAGTAEGTTYRYFPFNTQAQYVNSLSTSFYTMNHYFGTVMEVEFYQTPDGKIELADGTKEDMVFHFSGDDDVFIFVDNLLVGSVGGIHGRRAIDINFATGTVLEQRDSVTTINGNVAADAYTSISDYYNMAISRGAAAGSLLNHDGYSSELSAGGTLQPNTRHTLRMYYLERGNWDSNMEILFNLYYPYNNYVLQNTIVGGNQTLRDADFTYDLSFDMGNVIRGLITDTTTYAYEVYDASGEAAVQTGTVAIRDGMITAVSRKEGNTNTYLDASSKAYLSNGERVVFNLPDGAKVKATQSYPDHTALGLSVNPYLLDTMTITPSGLKISDTKPTAEAKILAASETTVVAYRNVIQTGDLRIIKKIEKQGKNAPVEDQSFTFAVSGIGEISRADGGRYPTAVTITVPAGELTAEALIEDIVFGTSVTLAENTDGLADNSFMYKQGNGTYLIEDADTAVEAEFTNLYAAALPVTIGGTKTLDGGLPQAGQFSFTIAAEEVGSPMPEETTATNDAEGKFSFAPMIYIKPGVHTYTITEVWGDDPYIDYDSETVYEVTVTVTANTADGTIRLVADVEIEKASGGESDGLIAFHNFTRGGVQIKLRKLSSYDDRVLPGAEFELSHDPATCPVCRKETPALMMRSLDGEQTQETEGPTLDLQTPTVQTAVTDSYGAIIFRGLIERHTYTLTETRAPQDYNLPEKRSWTVVNDGGTLTIDNAPVSGALVIHNRPTYWPVELQLQALKTMEGRTPKDAEKFRFCVVDASGSVIREAENSLGKVTFAPIVIERAGVYRYDIVEPWGGSEEIWYDNAVYTVTAEVVAVEDTPGEGRLEIASITWEKDGRPYDGKLPVFANRKAPVLPKTGDDSAMRLWLAILGISAAGALILFACRFKRRA